MPAAMPDGSKAEMFVHQTNGSWPRTADYTSAYSALRANFQFNAQSPKSPRLGLRCIASVVYNHCGEPLAAISVSGMTSRLTDDRLPTLGQTVREVAAELTAALGGVMPEAKSA